MSCARNSGAEPEHLTCPSAPAEPGSVVLGIVVASGKVAYLSPSMPVTESLLKTVHKDGQPIEQRMRFAGGCIRSQCVQWSEGRCGLIDRVLSDVGTHDMATLPQCGIRSTCRWFFQQGRAACNACPMVIRKPAAAQEMVA